MLPNSPNLGSLVDLTLPDRMEKVPRKRVSLFADAIATVEPGATLMFVDDLRTCFQDCLPWRGSRPFQPRTSSGLPQLILGVLAIVVLAVCLRVGTSLDIVCWWVCATLALFWALSADETDPVIDKNESAKDTAVLALVVVQIVSVVVIWTTFAMFRLR